MGDEALRLVHALNHYGCLVQVVIEAVLHLLPQLDGHLIVLSGIHDRACALLEDGRGDTVAEDHVHHN